jgi:hypothetical protein
VVLRYFWEMPILYKLGAERVINSWHGWQLPIYLRQILSNGLLRTKLGLQMPAHILIAGETV